LGISLFNPGEKGARIEIKENVPGTDPEQSRERIPPCGADDNSDAYLRRELDGLLRYLNKVRDEIAAIEKPADETHNFQKMGDQLDAIVKATEEATNTIMEAVEKNDAIVQEIRDKIEDPDITAKLDEIAHNSGDVFQACSFQDITGQRVNKLVKSLTYVEDRVTSLVEIWGRNVIENVIVQELEKKTEDEKLLQGPQLGGEGLSQDDIDALFD